MGIPKYVCFTGIFTPYCVHLADDGSGPPKVKKSASEKVVLEIDYDANIDFDKKFKKTRAATSLSKKTLER